MPEKSVADLMMQEPPMRYGATAVYKFKPNLERRFKFTSRYGDEINLARHEKQENVLHLPRAVCPVGPFDMRDVGEKVEFPKRPTPRENQKELFEQTGAFLKMGLSGVVSAYTGWGKTVLGFHAAAEVGRKTLVITTKDDIYKQWYDGAKQFLGLPDWEVGEIRGDKCEVQGTKFCVAMIHSLSKDGRYPDWISKGFGLVIFDECFHPDHELYVQGKGWTPVGRVNMGDRVMAFDALAEVCRFEPVERTVYKPFKGDLVRLRSNKFDTLTTPNHEQPLLRKRGEGWSLDRVVVSDIPSHSRVKLPIAAPLEETGGSLTLLGALRIAFEADGHALYVAKSTGLHTYRFSFRRQRKIDRLEALLQAIGLTYSKTVNVRGDTNIVLRMTEELPKDFGWFDPSVSRKANSDFLEELVEWDGWHNDEGSFWQHKDEERVSFVQTVAQLAGYSASIRRFDGVWRVRWFKEGVWVDTTSLKKELEPYDGDVFCVTVPSGNLLTRHAGAVSISGNCHRVPAEQFQEVVFMFPALLRLGLSATPKRSDGKDLLVQAHIGPLRAKTDAQEMVPKALRVETEWKCGATITVAAYRQLNWPNRAHVE